MIRKRDDYHITATLVNLLRATTGASSVFSATLLLLRLRSAHLEILGFPIGDAY